MALRAFALTTKFSQFGFGCASSSADNFYFLAAFELLGERRQLAIDTAGNTAVAESGMHRIGEIDGRCARWAVRQFCLWG